MGWEPIGTFIVGTVINVAEEGVVTLNRSNPLAKQITGFLARLACSKAKYTLKNEKMSLLAIFKCGDKKSSRKRIVETLKKKYLLSVCDLEKQKIIQKQLNNESLYGRIYWQEGDHKSLRSFEVDMVVLLNFTKRSERR